MKVLISGKHVDVGDSLRNHIQDKLKQVVSRYLTDAPDASVTLDKNHHLFVTDIALHAKHNLVIRAKDSDGDPYRSADMAIQKIEERMKRYSNRLRDRHRKEGHENDLTAQYYVLDSRAEDTEGDTPVIVAEMNSEILTLSVSEAVMRMDLSGNPVVMFKNAKNGQFNIVYRRGDGNIGWIDPSQK